MWVETTKLGFQGRFFLAFGLEDLIVVLEKFITSCGGVQAALISAIEGWCNRALPLSHHGNAS